MEKNNIKEKKIDILALWKSFINPKVEELSQEEAILSSNNLSEEQKKELLKTLNVADKIMNKTLKKSYKNLNVKADTKNIQINLSEKEEEKTLKSQIQGFERED